jgi:hypothetical protein
VFVGFLILDLDPLEVRGNVQRTHDRLRNCGFVDTFRGLRYIAAMGVTSWCFWLECGAVPISRAGSASAFTQEYTMGSTRNA